MSEWAIDLSEDLCRELQLSLTSFDAAQYQQSGESPGRLIFIVDHIGKIKIEVFSNEHPPPHFRVTCNSGQDNFSISDCTPLHGETLSRYIPIIRKWHKIHKKDLINAWNNRRPSDCPVGAYRE